MNNNQTLNTSCPYLGLDYDKATYSNFPSINNACYHVQPIAIPALSHQHAYCLTKNFENCPIYTAPQGNSLPSDLQHQAEKKPKNRKRFIFVACIILIIAILLVVFWDKIKPITETSNKAPTTTQTLNAIGLTITNTNITSIEEATFTPTPELERAVVTPSPLPSPTSSPSASPSFTQETLFRLENTIGKDPQFIIHRVIEGESLPLFANMYQTSVEAIRAVNYDLPRILWTDQIVIIPLNQTDMSGIPQFIAYEIVENGITFEQIADEFAVPPEELLRYNNINKEFALQQGDWILIPQMGN